MKNKSTIEQLYKSYHTLQVTFRGLQLTLSERDKENQFLEERCELLETAMLRLPAYETECREAKETIDILRETVNNQSSVIQAQDEMETRMRARIDALTSRLNHISTQNEQMENTLRIIKAAANCHVFEGEDLRGEKWATLEKEA